MTPLGKRRSLSVAVAAVVLLPLVVGCSLVDRATSRPMEIVESDKYELEFLRCSLETEAEHDQSVADRSVGGDTSWLVIGEYRITNLDDKRRRFDIRATAVDSVGVAYDFSSKHSDRLDPGESSVEIIDRRMVDDDVPPYTCAAEVWDSVIDEAFPDD